MKTVLCAGLGAFALSLMSACAVPASQSPAPVEKRQAVALPAVYAEALAVAESLLADPAWLRTPGYAAFREALAGVPAETSAAELVRRFNRATDKLGFSHFVLLPPRATGHQTGPAGDAGADTALPSLSSPRPGVALLRVPSFSIEAEAMTTALRPLMATPPSRLIIDLRGNSGGAFPAAAVLLGFLAKAPVDSGVFLSRPWFAAGKSRPDAAAIRAIPPLAVLDLQAFASSLQRDGVARLVLPAGPRPFSGQVLVLIDGESASATEPVAWLLRSSVGATLIGERSAGQMLSSEVVPLAGGYRLRLPVADYLTAEGVRLEGRGVEPDVQVPSAHALETALAR